MPTIKDYQIVFDEKEKDNSFTANQDAVKNIYNNTINANKEAADTSYQQADIISQKLAKYIPNYSQAQGVANSGLSETFINQQQANLENHYANINANLAQNNALAFENYQNAINDAKSTDSMTANGILQQDIVDKIQNNSTYGIKDLQEILNSEAYQAMTYSDKMAVNQQLQPYLNALNNTGLKDNSLTINNQTYDINKDKVIDTATMTVNSINSMSGVLKGTKQNTYTQNLINAIKNEGLNDGDLVNLNYGVSGKNTIAVYYDGKLYMIKNPTSEQIKSAKIPEGYYKASNGNVYADGDLPTSQKWVQGMITPFGAGGWAYAATGNESAKKTSNTFKK